MTQDDEKIRIVIEYYVEFDSNPPALPCFLCFQGCHDCSSFASPDSLSASPIGTVWLCRS